MITTREETPPTCLFHMEMQKQLESKVAKSSVVWMATIFSIPILVAIFSAWAFMSAADYKYGSTSQSKENASNIQVLGERVLNMKTEFNKMQGDISNDLLSIKMDIRELSRELKNNGHINDRAKDLPTKK